MVALNKELRELLHKQTKTKTERKRIDQINGTLLPNVRKLLAEKRGE